MSQGSRAGQVWRKQPRQILLRTVSLLPLTWGPLRTDLTTLYETQDKDGLLCTDAPCNLCRRVGPHFRQGQPTRVDPPQAKLLRARWHSSCQFIPAGAVSSRVAVD